MTLSILFVRKGCHQVPYTEQRKQERFPLAVPANLTVTEGRKSVTLQLQTRDISSSGAFLETQALVRAGTRVKVELFLNVKTLLELIRANTGARVRVGGRVVRSTEEGLAVEFARGFGIRPMGEPLEGWQLQ